MKTVAVIGAGPAGLCALKHLTARPADFRAVCFERAGQVGGTWVYTDQVGTDDDGLPVHAAMYESLRTNLPKDIMMFPDFPFPNPLPSFPGHEEVLAYIEAYANHFDLKQHVKFRTLVTTVRPASPGSRDTAWSVTVRDLTPPATVRTLMFDDVIVCNGQYFHANTPSLPGSDVFRGTIVHTHDLRCTDTYQDRTVVCLGGGRSAMDMCLELASVARKVYYSHRDVCLQFKLPSNAVDKPCTIKQLTETSVVFEDGEEVKADAVTLCTGYQYNFPFLSRDCDVTLKDDGRRVTPLYKHLVHTTHPTLFFLGIPQYIVPFSLFDIQMQFVLTVIDGSLKLPTKAEMDCGTQRELEAITRAGVPSRRFHNLASCQFQYLDELADMAGLLRAPQGRRLLYDHIIETIRENAPAYKFYNYEMTEDGFNVLGNSASTANF